MNEKNVCRTQQIKSDFIGLRVILTNGINNVANIGILSNVEEIKNINDLILQITGNIKNADDGIFIKVEGIFYKLSFEIVASQISKDVLESYIVGHGDRINYPYEIFKFCRFKEKVKQARLSTTGGVFLDWYSNGRVTNREISSYDGIWISGKYIRVLKTVPPGLESNISEVLFEHFNESNLFTTIGNYVVYVPGINLKSDDSYYENYIAINGIVIPEVKSYKSITNNQIIAIDRGGNEFVIHCDKEKSSESIA